MGRLNQIGLLALAAALSAPLALAQDPEEVPQNGPPPFLEDDPLDLRAWPFFESITEDGRREVTLLYVYNSVEAKGYRELHLRPFFDWVEDEAMGTSELDVLWPLLSHERKGKRTWTALRPFYWSHDDPQSESGYNALLPLWYSNWDKDEATAVGLPGFVYLRRGERQMLHLWPFFGRHELEGGGTRIFSLAHSLWIDLDRESDRGSFAAPFPLIFADWSPEEATTVVAPLLFARHRSGDSSWWASFPFALGTQSPTTERLWTIPYAYTKDAESERHDVLFPLFTREVSTDGSKRSWSLRPFVFHDETPDMIRTVAPPFFFRYSTETEDRFWTLPYQYNYTPKGVRHDVLFPLFTSERSHDDRERSISLRPFYFYDRNPERTWSLAPPFFHAYESDTETRFWTWPYAYTQDQESTRRDVLFPLFTHEESRDGSGRSWSLRPFVFHDERPDMVRTVAPPFFFRYSTETEDRFWTLPYQYNHTPKGIRHDLLFPLFSAFRNHDDTEQSISLRPFYFYDRNPERTWSLAPPLFHTYESAEKTRFWTWPYAYTKDPQGERHDVLFPLFTSKQSTDGSERSWSLRPFVFHDERPDMVRTVAPPFFFRYSTETEDRFWTLPYQYNHTPKGIRHDFLFPLFSAFRNHDDTEQSISLRPFYFYDRNPERTWSLAPPLFHTYESAEKTRFWTWPYAYTKDPQGERHDVLFPLFTSKQSTDGSERSWSLRPFVFHDETPDMIRTVAPPFFFRYSTETEDRFWTLPYQYNHTPKGIRHDLLFPLFSAFRNHDDTEQSISLRPFYFYDRNPERTWSLAPPLFHTYESAEKTRFWTWPYAYTKDPQGERHDVLFPLFTSKQSTDGSERSWSLRPFVFHDERPDMVRTVAPPFFFRYSTETEDRFWTLPYQYNHTPKGIRHDFLFPLFSAFRNHDDTEQSISLRPFYFYDRNPERTWSLAPPFLHTYESETETRFWTWPYAYTQDEESTRRDVLFPLFTHEESRDGSERSWSLRPFVFHDERPDMVRTVAPPFFFRYSTETEDRFWTLPYQYNNTPEGIRHDVLFPLFTSEESHDGTARAISLRPFFWYDRDSERTWTLAPPFVHTYESETETRFWTWPYAYTQDQTSTRHDVLFPFFTHEESRDGTETELSLRPFFFYGEDPERTWSLTLPFAYTFESEDRSSLVTPLFLHLDDRARDSEKTALLPFYWSTRNKDETLRAVLPFYFDLDYAGPDREIHLWPFFGYWKHGDYTEVSTLFPLAAYGSGPERAHSRFLPFWYYEREGTDWSFDVLWPLVRSGGDDDRVSLSLLGWLSTYEAQGDEYDFRVAGWLYRNRREGSLRENQLLPFWRYASDDAGTNFWMLYPLFEYESDSQGAEVDLFWKLYTVNWGEDRLEHRFLYKFVHYRRDGDSGLFAINPFFSYEWEGEDEALFQILGGAYYRHKRRGQWRSGGLWGVF